MSIRPNHPRVPLPNPTPIPKHAIFVAQHPNARKWWVVCASEPHFLRFVREAGLRLSDCNYISAGFEPRGLGFSNPAVELVVLDGWWNRNDADYDEIVYWLKSRYCQDRRVHEVPSLNLDV